MKISEIRKANKAAGGIFFDRSHTRHSTTLPTVYEGNGRVLFLTQDGAPPRFRAWKFNPQTAAIRLVASFETLDEATTAAKTATTAQA